MYHLKSTIQKVLRAWVYERRWWYLFLYRSGHLYNRALSMRPSKQKVLTLNCIKKVVIIYSKRHYDPADISKDRPNSLSSTATLAQHIYQQFKNAEVIYVDQREKTLPVYDADVIFGIPSKNFLTYCSQNPKAEKIVFLVNAHPLFRIQVMHAEALLRKKNIPFQEYAYIFTILTSLYQATKMLHNGNEFVSNTFRHYGTFGKKINRINNGIDTTVFYPDENMLPKEKIRILFTATELGIRKGFFRIISLWNNLSKSTAYRNVELVILGQSSYFTIELETFLKTHSNVSYKDWIDSTSNQYKKILQSSHIVLSLTLEEGQVGAIVEAMATGAVPIITEASGIGIRDNVDGFLIKGYDENRLVDAIEHLVQNRKVLDEQREKSRQYIIQNHTWTQFDTALKNIIANQ